MAVRIIQARRNARKKKVAAYIRTSTSLEAQEMSYVSQENFYRQKITDNPEWEFAGVYGDQESGTSDNRENFQRMIDDALAEKIDIILVKNLSRFARNTVDALRYCNLLSDNHVTAIFEQDNIDTSKPGVLMHLSLAASVAQSESETNSENHKWSNRKRAEQGIFNYGNNRVIGYDTVEGKLVPNGDAWIVVRIFRLYLEGNGYRKIASTLNKMGAKTLRGNDFSPEGVKNIIRNEIYVGDKEFGKIPSRNIITGEPEETFKKYVRDDHEGIVSREVWEAAQARMATTMERQNIHPFYGHIICGYCGRAYRRCTFSGQKVWMCGRNKGKKTCKGVNVKEKAIIEAFDGGEFETVTVFNDRLEMA